MGNDYLTTKKDTNMNNFKKNQDAKKSLNNYVNQLKIHFDLNDDEMLEIIKTVLKIHSQNDNRFLKKWWQIWK